MSTHNALEKYTRAMEALNGHIKQNKAVFDAHKRYVESVIDAENELRDAVATENKGVENSDFEVKVFPQTQTYADIEVIDAMVKEGNINGQMRDRIVKTIKRPLRISIRPKGE